MLFIFSLLIMLQFQNVLSGINNAVVLKIMSLSYGRQVYPCLKELNLGDDILNDFTNYWTLGYPYKKREIGCTVICVENKLNLLDKDFKLYEPNAEAWVRAAGGDDNMVKYVVYLYRSCQKVAKATDPCEKALEETNCFRDAVQRAQSSPNSPVAVRA